MTSIPPRSTLAAAASSPSAGPAAVAAAPGPGAQARPRPRLRGVSHRFAFFVAVGAAVALVATAGSARAALACAAYGAGVAAMFGVSATYHHKNRTREATTWRRLDHAAIFLAIAGTYTPICVLAIGGAAGARLCALVWAGAALGVVRALFWVRAPRVVTAGLYVVLGWAALAYWPEVSTALGPGALALIGAGGVAYTGGALIYALRRPDPAPLTFGYHEVFHACTIAGALCHFAAIAAVLHAVR